MVRGKINRNFRCALLISIIPYILIFSVLFVACSKKEKPDINTLPTFMDAAAAGKITTEAGDFKYEKQPFLGSEDAPVKVVEFGDFKCPACAKWDKQYFETFKASYIDTGIVQFYFVNFPFLGPDSIQSAVAGEIIKNREGNETFFQFKKLLYENQGKEATIWGTKDFFQDFVKERMKDINFDGFKDDLLVDKLLYDVKEDFKIAGANSINGTPTFMVNGKKVPGSSYEALKAAIEQERSIITARGNGA